MAFSDPSLLQVFCEYKIVSKLFQLEAHLSINTGIRPHRCTLCPQSFATKSKLTDHSRRHSGEKRFSCLVCNRAYSGSHDLRKHLKKCHPSISKNIKPNVPLTPQILANISVADAINEDVNDEPLTLSGSSVI